MAYYDHDLNNHGTFVYSVDMLCKIISKYIFRQDKREGILRI